MELEEDDVLINVTLKHDYHAEKAARISMKFGVIFW